MRLRERRRQPELMDEPGLDPRAHSLALKGLERINRWSRSNSIVWPPMRELARRQPNQALRVLDVATGAGDMPIRLWHRARRTGVCLEIEACDISPHALEYARSRAKAVGARTRFFTLDVLHDPLPTDYDVVMSSLFLHHLEEGDAIDLLRRMSAAARQLVLVNDLRRGVAGFLLAYVGTRVLSSSPIVHIDGPRSVEAAFTVAEARHLAHEAGLTGAAVVRRWPCRWLLTWRRA